MRVNLKKLREIQELDLRIAEQRTELEQLPLRYAKEQKEADDTRRELDEREAALKQARLTLSTAEHEIRSQEQDLERLATLLNTAKTNREYSALLVQINEEKVNLAAMEEEGLKAITVSEEAGRQVAQLSSQLTEKDEALAAAKAEVEGRAGELSASLAALEEERRQKAAEINPELFALYERVLARRGGLGCVEVVDGTCQGCYVRVTPQETNLLLPGDQLVQCRSCSRILYMVDDRPDPA